MIKEFIKNADMVLVGIGEEFQEKFDGLVISAEIQNTILADYEKKKYLDKHTDEAVKEAYQKLAKLLEGKNYFIVTLCNDDRIYESELKADRITAPCGTCRALQCEDVCTKDIYPLEEYETILAQNKIPYCPHCGKKLIVNRIGCGKYSEEGYTKQWNLYTKWLQGTLNKKLCVLELGVGMSYPTVVRWPFERVAYINKSAKFIRVHEHLSQLTEELSDKGISVQRNAVEFLRNQIV